MAEPMLPDPAPPESRGGEDTPIVPLDAAGLARLDVLATQFRREAELWRFYRKPWVKPAVHPSGQEVHNVFIVGAGHCGSSAYWGLRQFGIDRIKVIDARPAGQEGVWAYYERMHSLRTPKELTGPDWGFPSLTFHAYCVARYGEDHWQKMRRVLRLDYADYMAWYRRTLEIPIQNDTRLVDLKAEGGLLRLDCERAGRTETHYARTVVLSTGYFRDGAPHFPDYFRALPAGRWAHAAQPIDFAGLRGKRVGILGHGAGAFDCAGMALEAGAASVDLCYRRDQIPLVNPYRWFEFPGFIGHFGDLDDATRWKFFFLINQRDQPPAQGGYDRAKAFPSFTVRPRTNWLAVRDSVDGVEVTTALGVLTFDFLIAATGLSRGVQSRPELGSIAGDVATWGDRYQPPPELASARQAAFAYLGPNFEFTEKRPGQAPYLKNIFAFSTGAGPSHGPSVTSLSGLRYSVQRVLQGVRSRLFTLDAAAYLADFEAYDKPELTL